MIVWTGSKKWLVASIKDMEECYEPFAGAGHVSLMRANTCYLNDACKDLVTCYEAMISDKKKVVDDARDIFVNMMNNSNPSAVFYDIRARYNLGQAKDPSHFLVLLCGGFNGLWRVGSSGVNVPFGGCHRKFPYESLLSTPIEKIRSVTCLPWENTSPPNDSCIVYADPPYAGLFVGYTQRGWKLSDNEELFNSLSKLKNPVLLSCSETDENIQILKKINFDHVFVKKNYRNSGHVVRRKDEILAFNDLGRKYVKFSTLPRSK